MKVGILAAGAGSRLRAGGFPMPKPLLPIAGVPLIGRLLGALQPLMPEAIVCIINNQGTSVADYVRQHYPALADPVCTARHGQFVRKLYGAVCVSARLPLPGHNGRLGFSP